jgi:hypothetical protein
VPLRVPSPDSTLPTAGMRRNEAATILGVDVAASEAEIKANYRRLALRYHPDKVLALHTETSGHLPTLASMISPLSGLGMNGCGKWTWGKGLFEDRCSPHRPIVLPPLFAAVANRSQYFILPPLAHTESIPSAAWGAFGGKCLKVSSSPSVNRGRPSE